MTDEAVEIARIIKGLTNEARHAVATATLIGLGRHSRVVPYQSSATLLEQSE